MDVFVELRAVISDFQAKMSTARTEMEKTSAAGSSKFQALGKGAGLAVAGVAVGAAAIGAASVKMAADFQQSMSKLVTSGGETKRNLGADMKGVITLMGQTGTSSQQLAAGLYMINSAGFHGAAGLTVLTAAAEGAKTENADLSQVTDGLTTLLNDYHLKAADAALVTSKMVEATSLGKTTFQDLAGSLHTVAPAANAVGLSMNEVLGAMAEMTSKGTPAADAATYLRQTILQLSNPTAKAALEMKNLGLSSLDVSQHLGQRGLTGTLDLLTNAIQAHMGPAGTVLIDQLKKASGSTTTFQQVLANLPPAQQTYVGALANMVGGTKSMQAALELTGGSAAEFRDRVAKIGATATETGGHVAGWATVQQNFNQKLAEAKGAVEGLGIKLGLVLIPVIEKTAAAISGVVTWFEKHKEVAIALGIVIGGALVVALGVATVAMFAAGGALAFMIGPVGLVILAIAALAAGAIYLATHWHQVWSDIKGWFDDAVKFLRSGFGTLVILITGPFAPLLLLALHWQEVWTGVKQVMGEALSVVINGFKMLVDATFAMVEGVLGAASHLPFIGSHFADALKSVKSFQSDVDSTLSGLATSMSQWGDVAGSGLAGGLSKGLIASLPSVLNTTASVAASVAGAMRKGLGVASPSTITTEIGMFVAKGLEVGMLGGVSGVSGAASRLAGAAGGIAPSGGSFAAGGPSGVGGVAGGGLGSGPTGDIVLQIDGREFARITWPYTRTLALQGAKRDAVRVGLS